MIVSHINNVGTKRDALDNMIDSAIEKVYTSPTIEFVRSFLAGIYIAFGCIFMLIVRSDASLSASVNSILSGIVFSIGLFAVFAAKGELFTGNCMIFAGVLRGAISTKDMLRTWGINILGNVLGVGFIALLLGWSSIFNATAAAIAYTKFTKGFGLLLISGILCNMLVCLSVIFNYSAKTLVDKFIAVLFPVTLFVAAGFEHSIADVFFAFLHGEMLNIDTVLISLLAIFIGNTMGGLFMATYYRYACLRK